MRIDHSRRGDVTIVRLEGEFDFHDVPSASEAIGAFVEKGAKRLLFDLEGLRFISSGGIGYLIQMAKRLRGVGGEVVLAHAPDSFRWIAQTLGIDRVIRIFPSGDEALCHLAAAPPDGPA